MITPEWLPPMICFEEYNGNWYKYLDAIYAIFTEDFIKSQPEFRGRRLRLKRHPIIHGKEATFWHMTSEGSKEADRTPDFRRCERIRWPKPIIENSLDSNLKVWSEARKGNKRIHIWFEAEAYLVVLDDRGDYLLPWTAFYIEHKHQKAKYLKRWQKKVR